MGVSDVVMGLIKRVRNGERPEDVIREQADKILFWLGHWRLMRKYVPGGIAHYRRKNNGSLLRT